MGPSPYGRRTDGNSLEGNDQVLIERARTDRTAADATAPDIRVAGLGRHNRHDQDAQHRNHLSDHRTRPRNDIVSSLSAVASEPHFSASPSTGLIDLLLRLHSDRYLP